MARYIDGPATRFENVGLPIFGVTLMGGQLGFMVADAPFIGMAVGCAVGTAIGWYFRDLGIPPESETPTSDATQRGE